MSGLAVLLDEIGCEVSGCDVLSTPYQEKVRQRGIPVAIGHDVGHLEQFSPELLVYSSAIAASNEELRAARDRRIPIASRAEVLSWLFNNRKGIGIAGTHGKTTTSSMIALILEMADYEPTAAIGGELCDIGGNAKLGSGEHMVAELDESDGSFTLFESSIAVVTNIDWDHVDQYPDMASMHRAFSEFLGKAKRDCSYVMCAEDLGAADMMTRLPSHQLVTYGWGRGWHWGATDLQHVPGGGIVFSVFQRGKPMGTLRLGISGEHNALNALAACAVAQMVGVPFETCRKALRLFRGAKRRLQLVGSVGGVTIYDDYGHHPREIRATIDAVRNIFPDRRLLTIFQPHRYTRTVAMYRDFAKVLSLSHKTYLLPIFAADEKAREGVTSGMIVDEMTNRGEHSQLLRDKDDAVQAIRRALLPGDLVLTLGAGDINMVGERLFDVLRREEVSNALVVSA